MFEGIDGSGKTTQAKLLAHNLGLLGLNVQYSKEPTDGPIGSFIRQRVLLEGLIVDPRAIALLYAADRSTHVRNTRFSNDVINIFDRYYYSSIAYQGALGVPVEYIFEINSFAPRPDLIFLLDIDPAVGLRRLDKRDSFENLDLLTKVRDLYLSLAKQCSMVIVDATQGVQEIAGNIMRVMEEKGLVTKKSFT